jgi:hypothetical protein
MADLPMTADGNDVDFTRDALVSGLDEYRQAAFLRISNDVTFTNLDYGLDLANELGSTNGTSTIGVRASAAIMNDERFVSAKLTTLRERREFDIVAIEMAFEVVAEDGTEVSLAVLVEAGKVRLI